MQNKFCKNSFREGATLPQTFVYLHIKIGGINQKEKKIDRLKNPRGQHCKFVFNVLSLSVESTDFVSRS